MFSLSSIGVNAVIEASDKRRRESKNFTACRNFTFLGINAKCQLPRKNIEISTAILWWLSRAHPQALKEATLQVYVAMIDVILATLCNPMGARCRHLHRYSWYYRGVDLPKRASSFFETWSVKQMRRDAIYSSTFVVEILTRRWRFSTEGLAL